MSNSPGLENRGGVFIGNINGGHVHHGFLMSLLESKYSHFYAHPGSAYLDSNRNMVVNMFYETDDDKLLFIDSDQAWVQDDIDTLSAMCDEHVYPIIGGVYYNAYSTGLSPVVYEWQWDEAFDQDHLLPVGKDEWDKRVANSDSPIIQVDAIGTGFMMIHRSVLDRFAQAYSTPTPYFAELVIPGNNFNEQSVPILYGEDLTFCCRAAKLGIPIFAHSDVSITHYKEMTLKF